MNPKLEERWYPGEEHFVEGYVPQSLNAEYSSLNRSLTWIGMGFFLASVVGVGTFIFGLAVKTSGDTSRTALSAAADGANINASALMWSGLLIAVVFLAIGYTCIRLGRKNYREYKRKYGVRH